MHLERQRTAERTSLVVVVGPVTWEVASNPSDCRCLFVLAVCYVYLQTVTEQ